MKIQRADVIAKNYSKALYAAAKQAGEHEKVMLELDVISSVLLSIEESRAFFSSPMIPTETKRSAAEKMMSSVQSPELREAMKIMMSNNRLGHLPSVRDEYHRLLDEEKGILRGKVFSSSDLADSVKKQITEKMAKHFGKQILFNYIIDPLVLGGTRVEIGGLSFDDSLQGHLHRMADDLNRSRA